MCRFQTQRAFVQLSLTGALMCLPLLRFSSFFSGHGSLKMNGSDVLKDFFVISTGAIPIRYVKRKLVKCM